MQLAIQRVIPQKSRYFRAPRSRFPDLRPGFEKRFGSELRLEALQQTERFQTRQAIQIERA